MRDTVTLRRFRPSDLDDLLAIERSSFRADAYPPELFLAYFRRCPEFFLAALTAGRMAGYSITCTRGDRAELVSIAVAPHRRRSGVGQALVRGTLRRLRLRHVRRFSLMVKANNRGALRFYEAFGFRPVRRVLGYYEDGSDGLRMTREL